MKDILNRTILEGDHVVLIPQNGYNKELSTGIVKGFTDTKVKIRIVHSGALDAMPVCIREPLVLCVVDKNVNEINYDREPLL